MSIIPFRALYLPLREATVNIISLFDFVAMLGDGGFRERLTDFFCQEAKQWSKPT
ncbi:MAG: hypothetical protein WC537_02725 [Candidatus Paceibacterota bacterium]